ncbi:MAG TPA: class I SAM-dependent methyltransferase [Candidatus Limnocylindria bacterium]|nr:class I SAM-dependent methyltransferase [Candidatus Limnocylindria bacterium]
MPDLTDDARRNRAWWDRQSDGYQERNAAFIEAGMAWGVWQLPEAELQVLGDVAGRDVLELGCGAAEWSRALLRHGARVTGLDNSPARLERAREANAAAGVDFPLVVAGAEQTPFPDAAFDVVMADHGAPSFADPYLVVPEVTRLLRPGGIFAFSASHPMEWLAFDPGADAMSDRLVMDYFGMHRIQEEDGPVEYNLPIGEWIRLFRANGLAIEALIEPQPPEDATSTYRDEHDRAWARRWPMEMIWRVRKGEVRW